MGCNSSKEIKKEIPLPTPIDISFITENFGDDPEFTNMIIEQGISEFGPIISQIEKDVMAQDYTNLRLHSHSLKGSSANIACVHLSDISKDLEKHSETIEDSPEWVNETRSLCNKLQPELDRIVSFYKK